MPQSDEEAKSLDQKFSVKKGNNGAVIKLSGQTYVTVYDKNGMLLLSDKSRTDEVTAILEPGSYVAESDGKIGSISSIKREEEQLE